MERNQRAKINEDLHTKDSERVTNVSLILHKEMLGPDGNGRRVPQVLSVVIPRHLIQEPPFLNQLDR